MTDRRLVYFIGGLSSLSAAGSSMMLIALSTALFAKDTGGTSSSMNQMMMYFGVAAVGLMGGGLLQRFSAPLIGFVGPILSAAIVVFLAVLSTIPHWTGLTAAFLLFFLGGLDHPNHLRFLNSVLEEKEKISFFSRLEVLSYVLTVSSPLLAAWLINRYGMHVCFLVDSLTYFLSAIPWLFLA